MAVHTCGGDLGSRFACPAPIGAAVNDAVLSAAAVDVNGKGDYLCESQESKLAVLWTIGIFALNFGPVLVGPLLDWAGPKLTAITGELVTAYCNLCIASFCCAAACHGIGWSLACSLATAWLPPR